MNDNSHTDTFLWWARQVTSDQNIQIEDLERSELRAKLLPNVNFTTTSTTTTSTTTTNSSLVTQFWNYCTSGRKQTLQEWVQRVTGHDKVSTESLTKLAQSLNFQLPACVETGDEFDMYVFLTVLYNKFQNGSKTSRKEFNEFFGDCALSRTQIEYSLRDRVQVETAVILAHNIKTLKMRHYRRSESLLLEVIELLGQFAEFEESTVKLESSVVWGSTVTHVSASTDIVDCERSIACEERELPRAVNEAVKAALFCENFSIEAKQKILEEHFELDLLHKRISLLLKLHNLPPFVESLEVSTTKVSRFITLLETSESSVFAKCESFIAHQVEVIGKLIEREFANFNKHVELVMQEIVDVQNEDVLKLRTIKATHIANLKKIHLATVQQLRNLEDIYTSLGREFDKRAYLMKINKNRRTVTFILNTIDTTIENTINAQTEYRQLHDLLDITADPSLTLEEQLNAIYESTGYKLDKIRLLFDHFDTNHKGYLTKSEFKKVFVKAYPDAIKLSGEDEIDTIFETNYETVGKVRRGMEFKQFETIVKLGLAEKDPSPVLRTKHNVKQSPLVGVTDDKLNTWKVNPLCRKHLRNLADDSNYDSFFANIGAATDVCQSEDSTQEDDALSTVIAAVQALEPFAVEDL